MSKCPDCKKLHILKRELCDTCYVKELEAKLDAVRKWAERPTDFEALDSALNGEDTSASEDTCTCCFCMSVKALNGEDEC